MKKFLITLLFVLCTFVFIGCGEKEYSLEINVIEKVFVDENSNYEVTLLPDKVKLADYNYSSSNDNILSVGKNTCTGVSEGSAYIKIVATVDNQEVTGEVLVVVSKKEEIKNYKLNIETVKDFYVGDSISLKVNEVLTGDSISEFSLFSSDESIVKIEENKLNAINPGKTIVKVSCVYEGITLNSEIEVTVLELIKTFEVKFMDKDGNILKTEIVNEGASTTAPDAPEVNGFVFVGWDKEFNNVTQNLEVYPIYEKINKESKIKTNIPETLYVNQLIDVLVYDLNDNPITDYEFNIENEDILFFDDGLLEPFDVGVSEITIIATIDGNVEEYTFTLEILEGYTLSIDVQTELVEGDKVTFTPYINPGNIELKEFSATVSNSNVLSVKDNTITGLLKGTSVLAISTTYEGVKVSGNVKINVSKFINTYLDYSVENYMFLNDSKNFEIRLFPYNQIVEDYELKIDDSYSNILKFENGKLNPIGLGKAVIKINATVNNKKYIDELEINVYEFSGIEVEFDETIDLNEVSNYKVFALPNKVELKDHIIESSNDIIGLNQKTIFGKSLGEDSLTVKYNYLNKEYAQSIDVNVVQEEVKVERLYIECSNGAFPGEQKQLTIKTYPEVNDAELVYSSSDNNIATINNNGLLTTKNYGKVTIKVELKNNPLVYTVHELTVINKNETSVVSGNVGGTEYQGRYYEESVKYYYELMNGITETSYIGYTSTKTAGIDVDGYTGLDEIIEVDKYYPQNVHVLEIPSQKNTKIIPWAKLDNDIWTLTTVKGLINDYEEDHPGSKVICAINGDFFDINAEGNLPYQTTGENISDGDFYKTSNGHGVGVGGTLGFTNDGSNLTLISGAHAPRTESMILAIYDENDNIIKELTVETLNAEPETGKSSVYFGTYDSNKDYIAKVFSSDKSCFIVEKAIRALPNNEIDFYGLGNISKISESNEEITLEKGSFAIVSDNDEVKNALKVGTKIRIQYEFTGDFANVQSATGYNRVIYEDVNQLPAYIADRAPRTCVGMRADGTLVMMVIDGRQGADNMYGADGTELAAIMKAYGCVKAYNLDGGGSSTIVVRDETGLVVLNTPSDGRERNDGNCILIVSEDPDYKTEVTNITPSSADINVFTENQNYKNYIPCIKMNNEIYECTNGKLSLSSLVHNTTYNYKVMYKDTTSGKYYETLTTGSFTTGKSGFKFLGITLEETEDAYIYKSYSIDGDKGGNVGEMEITVDGQVTFFKNGQIILKKSIFGEYLNKVSFRYRYTDNLTLKEVILQDYEVFVIK